MKNQGSSLRSISIRDRFLGLAASCAFMVTVFSTAAQAEHESKDFNGAFYDKSVSTEVRKGGLGTVVEWEFVNLQEQPMVVERIEGLDDTLTVEPFDQVFVTSYWSGSIIALLKPDKLTGDFKRTIQVFFEGSPMPVELTLEAKLLEEHEKPSVKFVETEKPAKMPFQVSAVVE